MGRPLTGPERARKWLEERGIDPDDDDEIDERSPRKGNAVTRRGNTAVLDQLDMRAPADLSPAAKTRAKAEYLRRRVLSMSRQGLSRAAIAAELDIGPRVVQRIERAAGIQRSPGQPPKGDAKLRRVLAYVEAATLEEIDRRAAKVGAARSDWVREALERAIADGVA